MPVASLATTTQIAPTYPESALEQCLEGWVLLQFSVLPNGTTTEVVVLESEPNGVFEATAIVEAKKLRYRPEQTPRERVDGVQFKFVWAIDLESASYAHCRKT